MHRAVFFCVVLCSAFLVCSCGTDAAHEPHTAYIHLSSDPDSLNPIVSTTADQTAINKYIYESMIDRDDDTLEFIPKLALRWDVSSDGLTYTFYLRHDVVWSDGVPFTADDVEYSYRRIKDPKVACAPLKVYFIDVQRFEKLDQYTVRFVYSRPYFKALEICGLIPIVPKHIFDNGTDFNTHKNNRFPIGTGPFKFEAWDTGKRIVLTRNERYRGQKPDLRKIVYKIVAEPNIALQMLKKGELDVIALRPIQWVRQTNSAKFSKNFYKLRYSLPTYSYIGWNAKRDVFADARVRTALTYMINRQAILDKAALWTRRYCDRSFLFKQQRL